MQRLKSDPLLHVAVFVTVVLVILIVVTPLTWAHGGGLFSILMILALTGRGDGTTQDPEAEDGKGRSASDG